MQKQKKDNGTGITIASETTTYLQLIGMAYLGTNDR